MSRQDRATTEKFTRTLRELVKRPENKVCADCKRNDPRWASWNLGVFLCIRCSGIHRGMGTHISKVKSVDLDTWTPEQMESIQRWGNHLANLYWEAHLKPGHIPPEHKMESFIRSKYESRRWALDGAPPTDPSILANGAASPAQAPAPAAPAPQTRATHTSSSSISRPATGVTTRQPQAHQLLSANYATNNTTQRPPASVPAPTDAAAAAPAPTQPANDLFSLDFHAPAAAPSSSTASAPAAQAPKKDVKQDILSLFSAPPPASTAAFGQFGGTAASLWGAPAAPVQPTATSTSMMGTAGVGAWGASSGWGAPAPQAAPAQSNMWGAPAGAAATSSLFNTNDVWGAPAGASTGGQQDLFGSFGSAGTGAQQQKKDDVFGDLWGGFR
ncbi:hypothetical protein H0H81_007220 [Sphagnurus paluster]|uniref:Arf-GAP domain-containing protein n=1 Tax=Sphagnurus paluster TaxID=117069 RepID=A0A9P7GL78_9AGAR|nr:hypothetical protein H0H81_007220 [Sphagnurus paluster]